MAQSDVNNQFALYYPEKRPFFLEGADYFTSPIQAVFTRTVADPSVGAKLTGKRGKNTFGFFAAQDEVTNFLLPGPFESTDASYAEDNSSYVGRYSRGFGAASTIGLLVTGREGDGYHNRVGGADLRWHISDQHNVQAQYLRSGHALPGGPRRGDMIWPKANSTAQPPSYAMISLRATGLPTSFIPRVPPDFAPIRASCRASTTRSRSRDSHAFGTAPTTIGSRGFG